MYGVSKRMQVVDKTKTKTNPHIFKYICLIHTTDVNITIHAMEVNSLITLLIEQSTLN